MRQRNGMDYGLWIMGFGDKIPAYQLGKPKNVWVSREYGLCGVWVMGELTVFDLLTWYICLLCRFVSMLCAFPLPMGCVPSYLVPLTTLAWSHVEVFTIYVIRLTTLLLRQSCYQSFCQSRCQSHIFYSLFIISAYTSYGNCSRIIMSSLFYSSDDIFWHHYCVLLHHDHAIAHHSFIIRANGLLIYILFMVLLCPLWHSLCIQGHIVLYI